MTDFNDVRIPAARLGSGIGRNASRTRRHITKGFYDLAAGGTGSGSIVVNETTNWLIAGDGWFNVYSKTLTSTTSEAIADPGFVGQMLILNLADNGSAYTWTCTGTLSEGTTDHTQVLFSDDGTNIMLVGLYKLTALRWYSLGDNGATLS